MEAAPARTRERTAKPAAVAGAGGRERARAGKAALAAGARSGIIVSTD